APGSPAELIDPVTVNVAAVFVSVRLTVPTLTLPDSTYACDSTVAATFGVPFAGVYGVERRRQTFVPLVGLKMPLTVKSASKTFAPNAAPPWASGMSDGGRHTVSE